MKILLVEDEVRISNLLRIYLERESYQVVIEEDGDMGLDRALNEEYDPIILDVLMPGKDGYTVLKELRKVRKTPTIILTAKYSLEDRKQAMELGANEFIAKPFSPSEVVLKVKELLSQAI